MALCDITVRTDFDLIKEGYLNQTERWPKSGRHILAHFDENTVVVYQAYKPEIAKYAVQHQQLGGPDFSFDRMSWIKPNFLWMMYRCGWAQKHNQEHVLAVWLTRAGFDDILSKARTGKEEGTGKNKSDEVRLQWDPDHDPHGNNLPRRAIQLGMRGNALELYAKHYTVKIEDITEFVQEQFQSLSSLHRLLTPRERVYVPSCNNSSLQLDQDFVPQQTVVGFTS